MTTFPVCISKLLDGLMLQEDFVEIKEFLCAQCGICFQIINTVADRLS